MLASGMDYSEVLADFPELESADILASLAFASERELTNNSLRAYEYTA